MTPTLTRPAKGDLLQFKKAGKVFVITQIKDDGVGVVDPAGKFRWVDMTPASQAVHTAKKWNPDGIPPEGYWKPLIGIPNISDWDADMLQNFAHAYERVSYFHPDWVQSMMGEITPPAMFSCEMIASYALYRAMAMKMEATNRPVGMEAARRLAATQWGKIEARFRNQLGVTQP